MRIKNCSLCDIIRRTKTSDKYGAKVYHDRVIVPNTDSLYYGYNIKIITPKIPSMLIAKNCICDCCFDDIVRMGTSAEIAIDIKTYLDKY